MTWAYLPVYAVLITQLAPPTAKFLTTRDSEGGITNNISEVCAEALNMTVIQAQVILRAPDGSSLLDTESPPSDEQLERFRPSQEAVEAVTRKLSELGFRVGESGAVGITVAGDKATFERVFETTLSQGENRQTGTPSWTAAPPVTISDDLRTWIADVVFPIAPEFMP